MTQYLKINKEDSELMHYGVLGMHWGKVKQKISSDAKGIVKDVEWGKRRTSLHDSKQKLKKAPAGKAFEKAEKEYISEKATYKKVSELNPHQKDVRLGLTAATAILLTPLGGAAVAGLSTSYYRNMNAKTKDGE